MCKGLRNTPAASQAMSPATRAQVQQGTTFWMGYREGGTPFNTKIPSKSKINANNINKEHFFLYLRLFKALFYNRICFCISS